MEHELVINKNDASSVDVVVACLEKEYAMVLPCDTIYGLSAVVGNAGQALLRTIKGRSADKAFLVLATLDMARSLAGGTLPVGLEQVWPAPLTAIITLPHGGTLAIRVPEDSFIQEVLRRLGRPIYSTSVNKSGEKAMVSFDEIFAHYGMDENVSLFVIGPSLQPSMPSTIIDCTVEPYHLVRQGAFDATALIQASSK